MNPTASDCSTEGLPLREAAERAIDAIVKHELPWLLLEIQELRNVRGNETLEPDACYSLANVLELIKNGIEEKINNQVRPALLRRGNT